MAVFFEKDINIDMIISFLVYVFSVNKNEIQIFEEDYFYDEVENYTVHEITKCLCLYANFKGDVSLKLEFFRVENQSPQFMIEKVTDFLIKTIWDGFIIVENTDDDYLKLSNYQAPQSMYVDDEFFDEGILYLSNKTTW